MVDDSWATAWPGFDFGLRHSAAPPSRESSSSYNRREPQRKPSAHKEDGVNAMWTDKHCPQSEETLAVHKKKVAEVRDWLLSAATADSQGPRILLLTGPVGVGKSATVRVLARELGFDITEWANPVRNGNGIIVEDESGRVQHEQSAMSQFKDFIIRAQRYQPLVFGGATAGASARRLTVIEDLPNAVSYQLESFHEVLRSCAVNSSTPLLFIASDRSDDNRILAKLFPRSLMDSLRIKEIKFNPVAKTALVKALSHIAAAERFDISVEICAQLVEISTGDIRSAVNSLQMFCIRGVKKLMVDPSSKRKRKKSREKHQQQSKDPDLKFPKDFGNRSGSLDMFHALGRILNAKRGIGDKDTALMPRRLAEHGRLPSVTKGTVESVIEASNLPADMFTLFLHENYTSYVAELDDLEAATEHFSDADMLMSSWQHRKLLAPSASSIACRGYIHSNTIRSSAGFRPMHAPKCLSIDRETAQNAAKWKITFYADDPSTHPKLNLSRTACGSSLYTDVLPYLCKIVQPRALSGNQNHDLAEIASFGKAYGHYRNATFTDRDSARVLASVLEKVSSHDAPMDASNVSMQTMATYFPNTSLLGAHKPSSSTESERMTADPLRSKRGAPNYPLDDVEDWDSDDD
eukprot:m.512624 g.512624  ORF g.512624 m.512624 type:complete len:635 (+) comp21895_c0_seq3:163-2067(+)